MKNGLSLKFEIVNSSKRLQRNTAKETVEKAYREN